MNAHAAGPEGASPLSGQVVCPGLDPEAHWDDAAVLRGEIYVSDHLSEHAAALARSHGAPSSKVRPGSLWQRFCKNRACAIPKFMLRRLTTLFA